jgi:hypothetical protein
MVTFRTEQRLAVTRSADSAPPSRSPTQDVVQNVVDTSPWPGSSCAN